MRCDYCGDPTNQYDGTVRREDGEKTVLCETHAKAFGFTSNDRSEEDHKYANRT